MLSRIAQQTLIYSLIAFVIIWGYIPFLWNMKWPWITLLALALVSLIAWAIAGLANLKTFFAKRSSQFGVSMIISALATLAILVTVNFVANLYNQKKDITSSQLYSLSSQSKNVASKISENLEIEVWTTNIQQMAPNQDLQKFLENYRIESNGKIKISIKNPNEDPAARERRITKDNVILFLASSGRESRIENVSKEKIEEQVTNAIVQAIKGVKKTICFTSGQGELNLENSENLGMSSAKQMLESSSYQTKAIDLSVLKEIPADCEALVLAGPSSEPTDAGLEMVKKYIDNNGKALVMLSMTSPQKWNGIIKPYGVEMRDDVILDLRLPNPVAVATQSFSREVEIVKSLDRPVILLQASSLAIPTSGRSGNFAVSTMISSAPQTFAKKKNGLKALKAEMSSSDIPGPHTVAVLIEDPRAKASKNDSSAPDGMEGLDLDGGGHHEHDGHDHGSNQEPKSSWLGIKSAWAQTAPPAATPDVPTEPAASEAKIVVISSMLFAANGFINQAGNMDLFMNSVSYLLEDNDVLGIRPRELKATKLLLSPETDRQVQATVYLLAGLCFLGALGAASRRRKMSV